MSRKRICSVLLACCMLSPCFPAQTYAAEAGYSAEIAVSATAPEALTEGSAAETEISVATDMTSEYAATNTTDESTSDNVATTTTDESTSEYITTTTTDESTSDNVATTTTSEYITTTTTDESTSEYITTTTTEESTTEETTTEARAVFSAEIAGNYPGGKTALTVSLAGNPGLEALGLKIHLPEVLTPRMPGGKPQINTGAALTGGELYASYNPQKHVISVTYAGDAPGAAEDLLMTVPLVIEETAVIGTEYPCEIQIDSLAPLAPPEALAFSFMPCEPLLRECPEALIMAVQNDTCALTLDPLPPEGSCTWTSSDPEVVTVDAAGNVTAVGNGTAEIRIECETRTYICAVTVQIERDITADIGVITEKGGTASLSLVPAPNHAVTWQSADESIAAVAEDGTVTGLANGETVITAACEGVQYTMEITVDFPCTLNHREYAAKQTGETVQLILQDAPAGLTLHWFSADEAVAAVDENGLVTFTGEGKTEITVECGDSYYTCAVTNLPYVRGDLDHSGTVDTKDSNLVLRHYNYVYIVEAESPLDALAMLAGDVDGDGEIGLRDAAAILRYYNYDLLEADPTWESVLAELH